MSVAEMSALGRKHLRAILSWSRLASATAGIAVNLGSTPPINDRAGDQRLPGTRRRAFTVVLVHPSPIAGAVARMVVSEPAERLVRRCQHP